MHQPASVAVAPARPKSPCYGSDMMPLRSSFFCKCHDDGGGCAIHANLEALDAVIEPTWRCAWLVVEAGVVALMLAFQGVAALRVVVAQFVVNGAMFLFLFHPRHVYHARGQAGRTAVPNDEAGQPRQRGNPPGVPAPRWGRRVRGIERHQIPNRRRSRAAAILRRSGPSRSPKKGRAQIQSNTSFRGRHKGGVKSTKEHAPETRPLVRNEFRFPGPFRTRWPVQRMVPARLPGAEGVLRAQDESRDGGRLP